MKPRILATLLTLVLALALGSSGPVRATAHGHEAGLAAMVICGEDGAKTVYVDATGHPAEPGNVCTDSCVACLPPGTATLLDEPSIPVPEIQVRVLAPGSAAAWPASRQSGPARARGPPTGVDPA